MYKRKIESRFEEWFQYRKIKKTALIVKGLRQTGKTTSVLNFCNKHFKNVIYINFIDHPDIKKYFDGPLDVDRIIMLLSTNFLDKKFEPNKTVLVFDEIQECADARTAIKPFMEDGRYDIVATGSLLGMRGYNLKTPRSIPVGFEDIIEMKPMDFEEYLWAKGINENVLALVKKTFLEKKPLDISLNEMLLNFLNEYLCVGGMPEVVSSFMTSLDMNIARKVQTRLLNSYKDDFGKHLNEKEHGFTNQTELTRILSVYNSIPNQLAKENKKFSYSLLGKNARARDYLDAIVWLEEYGLINRCFNINNLELPLDGYKDDKCFKVYFSDTGLFMATLDPSTMNSVLTNDLKIYKGALYENLVADAFSKSHKNLYYYAKDKKEIDFVTTYMGKLALVEVKAGNNVSSSLNKLSNKAEYNFKLIHGNVGEDHKITTLPLYMAYLLA